MLQLTRFTLITSVSLAVLCMVGCGGSDDSQSGVTTSGTSASSAGTTPANSLVSGTITRSTSTTSPPNGAGAAPTSTTSPAPAPATAPAPAPPPASASTAGTILLSSANYPIAQGAGSVTVTVDRIGGSNGAASVQYHTASGTAVSGTDYDNTNGTLIWANGDSSAKLLTIPIRNATPFSGIRTLSLALGSAIGATLGPVDAATVTINGDAVPPPTVVSGKSIRSWVSCDGVTDDTAGVAAAFAAASHGAFTLLVDCPVRIHSGTDTTHVIYIDDGTSVQFTGAGTFTVDNILHPAFVIANANSITLTDWNVEYDASLPVVGDTHIASVWNDVNMTSWLSAHRGIVFDKSQGAVASRWMGPTNTCAIFFVSGDTSNLTMTGLNVHVPTTAGGDHFVPVVFSLSPNWKSNQTVTAKTPQTTITAQYFAVPHDLTFTNVTFDGTYMGWVGGGQNIAFEHVRSHRYGDLQDANGQNVGGVGKWFAPPHLFYLSYTATGDPALFNRNITIHDVVDDGPRVGVARDKGGTDTISGYALSIKIGCVTCSVDTYTSNRPDGFMDVLPSDGLTVSNVNATYSSAFLNNLYPGWRFPGVGYSHMTFDTIALTDSATCTGHEPVSDTINDESTFSSIQVKVTRWCGSGSLLPNIRGQETEVALAYTIAASASRIMSMQTGTQLMTLEGSPILLTAGGSAALTWKAAWATSCSTSGPLAGAMVNAGSQTVSLNKTGTYNITLSCQNANSASSTTLQIVAQ